MHCLRNAGAASLCGAALFAIPAGCCRPPRKSP